jgi:hypothetical protein
MVSTPLEKSIEFLQNFGLFDVILPFLLVFTIIFAILEKTKILGVEEEGRPKKNLNSMVSFVIALLVVATNKIVTALKLALPNIVLLVIVVISFLILIGSFRKSEELEFSKDHPYWYKFFMVILFIAVIIIFLSAIQTDSGESWLSIGFVYLISNFSGTIVTSLIFLLVVLGAIVYITKGGEKKDIK